jgi:hypothetical protein
VTFKEMLEISGNLGLPTLFIPPGLVFAGLRNAMLVTDYTCTQKESFREMIQWLVPFHSNIHAFGFAGSTGHLDMYMESGI